MPTYEYICENGHTFERFQKMSDRPVRRCPVCSGVAERKVSGGQGLIFKGSGFYITDYGKDGKGPRKGDAASGPAESKPAEASTSNGSVKADKPGTGESGRAAESRKAGSSGPTE